MSDPIVTGNAVRDGQPYRGWFIGQFVPPDLGLRASDAVEVKWATHAAGETRSAWAASPATSLSLLVRGSMRLFFAVDGGREAVLQQPGDYALWPADVAHRWAIDEDDTIVVTVRWPSRAA